MKIVDLKCAVIGDNPVVRYGLTGSRLRARNTCVP